MRNQTSKLKFLSTLVLVLGLLAATAFAALLFAGNLAYAQSTVDFDFDTGAPPPSLYRSTPFNYFTSSGVTGRFSSPMDAPLHPAYSVQNGDTTGYTLSTFSGNYLWPSGATRSPVEIKFSQPLTNITFSFATMEFHTGHPSFVNLTAYMDSTATTPIGTASAQGTWPGEGTPAGDSYPQGTLTFNSGNPYNLVLIELPYQGLYSASSFLVDNIRVTTADSALDNVPPVTTASLSGAMGNQGWYTSNVEVSLSPIDSWSGVNKTEYSFDNTNWILYQMPFTVATEGTTTVYYNSTDNAGNVEAVKTQTVKIDKASAQTFASLSGVMGTGGWYTSTVIVTLSASDGVSGVAKTEYSFDSVGWTVYSGSFTVTNEGTSLIYFRSTDTAGNVETANMQTVKVDMTSPTGSVVINNGDASTTSTAVTLTLTSNDATSGVSEVRYSNDGVWDTEPWEPFSASKAWTLTAGDGAETVYYQIKDGAGLISATYQDSITLETGQPPVDTTKPVANAGPDQAVTEDTILTLDGSASTDNVAITSYTWKFIDSTLKTLTGMKPTYTFSTPGLYTVTLNVTDAAGNWATDTAIIEVVDTTSPVADAGQDRTVTVNETVTFDASASSDNLGSAGIVLYEWDFGDSTTGTGQTTTHAYTSPGAYTVTLTVKDAAGNTATDTLTITVLSTEAFPMWIAGVVVALIAVAVAAIFLWKRRKQA